MGGLHWVGWVGWARYLEGRWEVEKWRELVVEGMGGASGWAVAAGGGRGAELLAAPVATGRGPGVLVFLLRASLSLSYAAISSLRRWASSSCLWSRRLMSALSAR